MCKTSVKIQSKFTSSKVPPFVREYVWKTQVIIQSSSKSSTGHPKGNRTIVGGSMEIMGRRRRRRRKRRRSIRSSSNTLKTIANAKNTHTNNITCTNPKAYQYYQQYLIHLPFPEHVCSKDDMSPLATSKGSDGILHVSALSTKHPMFSMANL